MERELTILFADVVGSTHLYESLGDQAARETVQKCLAIMRDATEQASGTVIKTMGDEVMSTFPSADDGMNAARRMQQQITASHELTPDGTQVAIRIGCHHGPVTVEHRDIFGASVHTANRMTSQAKAGQVVVTRDVVDQLGDEWRPLARQIDIATVKGRSDELAVFEVLWQPDEATSMLPAMDFKSQAETVAAQLVLSYNGNELVMGEGGPTAITMGRADENDVVIKGNLISRLHARVEMSRNRFLLIDESTNGTFVRRDDGEEFYVRRDTTELSGSGVLSMGRVAVRGTPLAIEYRLKS